MTVRKSARLKKSRDHLHRQTICAIAFLSTAPWTKGLSPVVPNIFPITCVLAESCQSLLTRQTCANVDGVKFLCAELRAEQQNQICKPTGHLFKFLLLIYQYAL